MAKVHKHIISFRWSPKWPEWNTEQEPTRKKSTPCSPEYPQESLSPLWSCVAKWYNLCQFAIPRICWNCLWREFIAALRLGAQFPALPPRCHPWYIPKVLALPISRFAQFNSNASEMPLAVDMDLEWHGPMDLGCPINILCCSCSRSYGLTSTQVVFAISETTWVLIWHTLRQSTHGIPKGNSSPPVHKASL